MSLFIGLMSGTSADGMDAALISTAGSVSLIDALCIPYPKQLQAKLRQLALAASVDVNELITTERKLAKLSVEAVLQLLAKNKLSAQHITAIGSHGHTLRHQPQPNGFRSEEHTSELQSRPHLVCRLLLEKKKKIYCMYILL